MPLVTFADDRQRHADEWWWVEMAALTARRVVDMIAELSQRPLGWPGGPWRSRLTVWVRKFRILTQLRLKAAVRGGLQPYDATKFALARLT